MYGLQYFNAGARMLLLIAYHDLFKNYYDMKVSAFQLVSSIIWLPWSFRFLAGIVADTLPLFGSRKRYYLVLNGFLQFVTMMLAVSVHAESPYFVVALLLLYNLNVGFMDVIVDSIMVIEARRDPKMGSQDLQAFSWLITGVS